MAGVTMGLLVQADMATPVIADLGTKEQHEEFLKPAIRGEKIAALGVSEPNAGSDVAGIQTWARKDGDDYVINGSKTFISNGQLCDICVVAAKTDPNPDNAHKGISMFIVEAGRKGFNKGKRLHKMGMASQDTSELFFEDCRVPAANLLGVEGGGFMMMMQKLQQERLCVAIGAVAGAEQVLQDTIAYTKERKAFGKPISKFQNTQFKLVECLAKVEVGRAYVDKVIAGHIAGKHLVKECSIAKFWTTDMGQEVVDTCLQFFGGYGYMLEYPVTRAFMDARVQRIYAGTNEIMKVIVAKQLGL
jgi:acyl-CoA dehydrogenase